MNVMDLLDLVIALVVALAAQATLLAGLTGRQIRASEKRLDEKIDLKVDALAQVMDARLGSVDHRLSAVESDVLLIKQHLLSTTAA